MRECGECTACCEGWLPDESLDMYPGQPCSHCQGAGCAIYETRPERPCRTFRCAWLEDEALPEKMRPDRCGAIVLSGRNWRDWEVVRATPVGRVIPADTLEWLREHTAALGMPLIFLEREMQGETYVPGGRQLAFGPPDFAAVVQEVVVQMGFNEATYFTQEDVLKF